MSHPVEDDDCRNDQMAFIAQVMEKIGQKETCPYCRSLDVLKQSGEASGIETTWSQCGRCNYTWGRGSTEKTVYQKLQAARVRLQQEQVRKSGANKFAGFVYFTLGDFLPMVNHIFDDMGLCSVVTFTPEMATLRVIDAVTEKEIVFTSPMAEANLKGCHPIQNIGAVETYQRRYLYMAALEIAEHDILDMSADTKQTKHKSVAKETAATLDDVRLAQAREAADECLACLPDEMAFYEAYEMHKSQLDADTQVAMWGMLYGDNTPFPSANSVKTALARGKELSGLTKLEAEIFGAGVTAEFSGDEGVRWNDGLGAALDRRKTWKETQGSKN